MSQNARASSIDPAASCDFHGCWKKAEFARRILHRLQRTADRRKRGLAAALFQAQKGQSRLRIETKSAGRAISGVGFVEPSAKPVDLSLLIERGAGVMCDRAVLQAHAGGTGLALGLDPVAVIGQDLGAVNQAAAGKGDDLRLSRAPSGQRGGPFPRPVHVVEFVADVDDTAIDEACRRWETTGRP